MVIKLLDQELINKIAAGEVVERPASVVKELIENSIDAGATSIAVEIKNGGLDLIRVTDNGCGMNEEDAKMCIRRHATSKISDVNDLHNIKTLGFRGEALAAISAVSQFRLLTRQKEQVGAVELAISNRQLKTRQSAGPEGTVIEARGLFYTVPARKKFLKAPNTEFRYIAEVFTHQALMLPSVHFKLIHNGKTSADYPAVKKWKTRAEAVLGRDMSKNLIEFSHRRGSLLIEGFLAHPALARQRSNQQYIFVNGRPVKDYILNKAVKDGYHHHIAHGLQPSFVIKISIAPDLVDVNVHPRKSEVKFADPRSVYRELVVGVKEALSAIAAEPRAMMLDDSSRERRSRQFFQQIQSPRNSDTASMEHSHRLIFEKTVSVGAQHRGDQKEANITDLGDWKLVGQAHNSYIIVQSSEGVLIIDQHAAAEKILYEKLLEHLSEPKKQSLLVPVLVELNAEQLAVISENADLLQALGIEGEEFGGKSYRVTALPQDLDLSDVKRFVFELIDDIRDEGVSKIPSLEERQRKLAKYAACRGAIKFHDPLTVSEQVQLLKDIRRYNVIACCHGRPVMVSLTKSDLNKQFHRS